MDIIEERPNITLSANNNISVIILRFRHSLYACYLFELSYNKYQIECRDHRRHVEAQKSTLIKKECPR